MTEDKPTYILLMNKKGGVGKTTIADELTFCLERRGHKVSFVSTDPQRGSLHETVNDQTTLDESEYIVIDTHGGVVDQTYRLAAASDLIIVPFNPVPKNLPSTFDTLAIIKDSGSKAEVFLILNQYFPREIVSQNVAYFMLTRPELAETPIFRVDRRAAFPSADAAKTSVAEVNAGAAAPFEDIARCAEVIRRGATHEEVFARAKRSQFYLKHEGER